MVGAGQDLSRHLKTRLALNLLPLDPLILVLNLQLSNEHPDLELK